MAKTPPGSLSRGVEFEIIGDYTHPSPFSEKKKEKKKGNIFNPPLWCSFGGRPGTGGIHHRPKKSTEHTEPGGALAPARREEGQLASEQEVLGLIGQRETPLGHRSQRSVGTSLAHRLAWGSSHGKWEGVSREFSVDLRLRVALTPQQRSPSRPSPHHL